MSGPITDNSTYETITDYQREHLANINEWLERNGKKMIVVPRSDKKYYEDFKRRMIPASNEIVVRPKLTPIPEFSFFYKPIENITNSKLVNLVQVYDSIQGEYFKKETDYLRNLISTDRKVYGKEKLKVLHYVCFAGEFNRRENAAHIRHSGLLCADLDHLKDVHAMRERILSDTKVETQLLFISPSGDGLKWVISIDINEASHLQYFFSLQAYVRKTYGIEIDAACKDVSRACLLSHDPNAYINPKWLTKTL